MAVYTLLNYRLTENDIICAESREGMGNAIFKQIVNVLKPNNPRLCGISLGMSFGGIISSQKGFVPAEFPESFSDEEKDASVLRDGGHSSFDLDALFKYDKKTESIFKDAIDDLGSVINQTAHRMNEFSKLTIDNRVYGAELLQVRLLSHDAYKRIISTWPPECVWG